VFPAMPVILRMMGFFPENGTELLLWALVAFTGLGAMSGSILNISVMSALADIADEIELTKGLRQEGILYSARTFFAKLDNSIGHGLATLGLWLIAFPEQARPGQVDEDVIWWLGFMDSPLTILAGLIAAGFYSRYRINRESWEQTRTALSSRN
ncbi:MAG: MFS transporter, partial [Pseudomonadales bacterium]|nr:MFS transporter [Pseudomonadales bacterium]